MDRYKISDKVNRTGARSVPDSQLYTQLKENFDVYFSTDHDIHKAMRLTDYYVRNPIDSRIDDFISSKIDKILVVTGPRGGGKSASVQFKFGTGAKPKFLNSNSIVIPFYFDSLSGVEDTYFISHVHGQINAACTELKKICRYSPVDLYKFIQDTKSSVIESLPISPEVFGISDHVSMLNKIDEVSPLAYAICSLKFLANHSGINDIYLIADDMESVRGSALIDVCKSLLTSQRCMKHDAGFTRNYKVKLLISMRPATFEMIEDNDLLNGFDLGIPIQLFPVDIREIFERKFHFQVGQSEEVEIRKKWSDARSILVRVVSTVHDRHGDLFLGLSNYNIRMAFNFLRELIRNSYWFERIENNELVRGSANLQENRYITTDAAVVRGLSLTKYSLYNSNDKHPITNIFYNSPIQTSDYMSLLLIQYLYAYRNSEKYTVFNFNKFSKFIEKLIHVPSDSIIISNYIDYLIKHNAIRRSKMDASVLITQPKIWYIWSMLSKTSVFVECFSDDVYMIHPSVAANWIDVKASADLGENVFFSAFDFVNHVLDAELRLVSEIEGKRTADVWRTEIGYYRCTGCRILEGLRRSVDAFYKKNGAGSVPTRIANLNISAAEKCNRTNTLISKVIDLRI